ncbi:MAG: hypothetical protein K2N05_01575 [Muribaculaceae bacterium]|nr:hypothetical protein [Muribaculaceae bacterium]
MKKRNIKSLIKSIKRSYITKFCTPKKLAEFLYYNNFGRKIDWKCPTEFNEKIRWLQFSTDTSKWTLLADKYLVRKYLEDKGYGDMLVKLYGVWENAENIDFDKLPKSFVLKTNHGCGSVYVIKDKTKIDLNTIKNELNKSLSEKYGINTAEPHYFPIKPVIIAEEILFQDGNLSSSMIDYKLYCTYGEPQFCAVMFNRDIECHKYDIRLYDNNWQNISHLLGKYSHTNLGLTEIPRPKNFEKMKNFCRDLCKEFPFVRMDFYETDGKLYFGEFTFTPAACTGAPLGPVPCKILSDKIHIM